MGVTGTPLGDVNVTLLCNDACTCCCVVTVTLGDVTACTDVVVAGTTVSLLFTASACDVALLTKEFDNVEDVCDATVDTVICAAAAVVVVVVVVCVVVTLGVLCDTVAVLLTTGDCSLTGIWGNSPVTSGAKVLDCV